MKYMGRITLLILLFFNEMIWTIYDFMINNTFITHIGWAIIYVPLCWWLGLQYDKAKFYSEMDTLTEIHNRRFVLKIFPKLCALADRRTSGLGILILDIDDFKAINDKYGHKRGDLVLQQISNLLLQFTRKSDVVARWGGDEFLIILPLIEKSGIENLITRIQNGLIELSENIETDIAVSIGTAIYPNDAQKLESLMQTADNNMYKIKLEKRIS